MTRSSVSETGRGRLLRERSGVLNQSRFRIRIWKVIRRPETTVPAFASALPLPLVSLRVTFNSPSSPRPETPLQPEPQKSWKAHSARSTLTSTTRTSCTTRSCTTPIRAILPRPWTRRGSARRLSEAVWESECYCVLVSFISLFGLLR
jgi:hypothetical protein